MGNQFGSQRLCQIRGGCGALQQAPSAKRARPTLMVQPGMAPGVLLAVTIALEVSATTCMKMASRGSPWWNVGVYGGYILCFSIFPFVLKHLPLGVAYAIWSGAGTAMTPLMGALIF